MRYIRNILVLTTLVLAFSVLGVNAQTPATPLEKKVFKEIRTLPYYGVFDHIAFQVDGTTVTLTGKVYSLGTRRDAERWVKDIPGVDRVVNNIEQLPNSGFDDSIRRETLRSFVRSGGSLYRYLQDPNPSMRIIVDNGHITLEGYVAYKGDSDLANLLARGVPGAFSVTNHLIVERGR